MEIYVMGLDEVDEYIRIMKGYAPCFVYLKEQRKTGICSISLLSP